MKLVSVQFRNGVSIAIGGKWSALTFWNHEKHGRDLVEPVHCEEQKNGDVWLTTRDGRRRVLRPWAVDVTTYEPDSGPVKVDTTPRRAV